MTTQEKNRIRYGGREYAVIGVRGVSLPTPDDYGVYPDAWHDGCYAGFISTYLVQGVQLYLDAFHIGQLIDPNGWKPINGVKPVAVRQPAYAGSGRGRGNIPAGRQYCGLDVPVAFSGELLIARDYIPELHVPDRANGKPYQYREIHELWFVYGELVVATDRSGMGAKWRAKITKRRQQKRQKLTELKAEGLTQEEIAQQYRAWVKVTFPAQRDPLAWNFIRDYDEWY
ncbi:MAG: hypothetical protein AAF653_12510 [Chloroflexota bacterium]